MFHLNPQLYQTVHIGIVFLFTLFTILSIWRKSSRLLISRHRFPIMLLFYILFFIYFVSQRPITYIFGDTVNYAATYYNMAGESLFLNDSRDVLFTLLMWWCAQRMPIGYFFLIVDFFYIVPMVIACWRITRNNYDIALLFCLAAFSFFSYAVNGIRNGMACSIVMLAISFIQGGFLDKIVCALLSIIAINIHGATALPVLCMVIAYFINNPRVMFWFWGISIVLSLIAGGPISNFFASLGFDERLSEYISAEVDEGKFSRTGFRWDFLLYSALPIVLGYYLILKKKIFDSTYLLILGTYIYANSFWIMVIRANYSNRFAYLSWFLYPIVLSYPLLKLGIWPKTQGEKTSIIMMGHLAFTLLMTFVFK